MRGTMASFPHRRDRTNPHSKQRRGTSAHSPCFCRGNAKCACLYKGWPTARHQCQSLERGSGQGEEEAGHAWLMLLRPGRPLKPRPPSPPPSARQALSRRARRRFLSQSVKAAGAVRPKPRPRQRPCAAANLTCLDQAKDPPRPNCPRLLPVMSLHCLSSRPVWCVKGGTTKG